MTVTEVFCGTDLVSTAKVADVEPAVTTTLAGNGTALLFELVSVTLLPPLGAGAESAIVTVIDVPPRAVVGAIVIPASAGGPGGAGGGDGGVTVKVVVFATPAYDAVSVAEVSVVTADVPMANVAVLAPL